MNAWTAKYRNLVQIRNATASSTNGEFVPSMVLRRQAGWNTVHDRDYFDNHSRPFYWGVRSYYSDNAWTKTTMW
jgi:hypothetical protein